MHYMHASIRYIVHKNVKCFPFILFIYILGGVRLTTFFPLFFLSSSNKIVLMMLCLFFFPSGEAKPKVPTNFEEDTWSVLKSAIAAVFLKQPVSCSLEDLYQV